MSDTSEPATDGELDLEDAVRLGVKLHQSGDHAGAARIYASVLRLAPDMPAAVHFCGVLLDQRGDEDGLTMMARSLELSPREIGWWGNYAQALAARGRNEEAETAFLRGVAVDPSDGAAYLRLEKFLTAQGRIADLVRLHAEYVLASAEGRHPSELGRANVRLGRLAEGAAHFQRWLDAEPHNPVAAHLLKAARGETPERAGDEYVALAFDNYADRFDEHIVSLDYRGPSLIARALEQTCGAPRAALDIIDAGCGTGLCAAVIKPYARRLVGVDLSQGMLDRAARLGLYDELTRGELTAFLEGLPAASCDVVVICDTFCYFGRLEKPLEATKRALREGGSALFTLEASLSGGVTLDSSGRYQHSDAHVREAASAAGLAIEELRPEKLRDEGGRPVAGWLVRLKRAAAKG